MIRGVSAVLTGENKGKIDKVWNTFWSGGDFRPAQGDRADLLSVVLKFSQRNHLQRYQKM